MSWPRPPTPPMPWPTDSRYATSCLAPPRLWGVVAIAADTTTTRISVRTPTAERDRIARALREEVTRRLHALGVFGSAAS